jgi:branched-chain amino acid transport system permease protein
MTRLHWLARWVARKPLSRTTGAVAIVILAVFPQIFSNFVTSTVGVRSLWLGIAATSLTFLAGYGGMVSLAQTAMYGIAGFTLANVVASNGGVQHNHLFGLDLGANWGPWWGALAGIVVATVIGLLVGAVAARSQGIYFLMLTLAFGVLVYYLFGQVLQLSGFGGINQVPAPHLVGDPVTRPEPLYYTALICAVSVYILVRYIVRTPFGLALQGIRDDPVRMGSLGYNVVLHRTLAFGFGAFIASIAGVLSVWYNTQISPGSIDLTRTIDVLAIAVVGGLYRLEGAWVGAFAFTLVDYSVKRWLGTLNVFGGSFNGVQSFETWFGIIFLAIIILSPGGLMGLWTSLERQLERLVGRRHAGDPAVERL